MVLISVLFYLALLLVFLSVLPKSPLMKVWKGRSFIILTTCVCLVTVALCVIPMDLSPVWNGEIPKHRNQYELMADSILQGRLYLDLPVDPQLLTMDNPYDRQARDALGVTYYWDHAFYGGKYYMYFGVVPSLLVFAPFKLLTGATLTTYHATQLFCGLFIVGLFVLFNMMRKRWFEGMPEGMFLALCVAASAVSTWYLAMAPALYCTAIAAAICFGVWCLVCVLAALTAEEGRHRIVLLFAGALCGALTFGCRPPVGLMCGVFLPTLFFLFKHCSSKKEFAKFFFAIAIPFLLVACALMAYNYLRFDSPFEFGQSYQLTVADQTSYSGGTVGIGGALVGSVLFMFQPKESLLDWGGLFVNVPLFILAALTLLSGKSRAHLHKTGLIPFLIAGFVAVALIGAIDTAWSPFILERYHSDAYWIATILMFPLFGSFYQSVLESEKEGTRRKAPVVATVVAICCLLAVVVSAVYFCIPYDSNIAAYDPHFLPKVFKALTFGMLG